MTGAKMGRPATGWVKTSVKLSPEAAALLAAVPAGAKSATVDEAVKAWLEGKADGASD